MVLIHRVDENLMGFEERINTSWKINTSSNNMLEFIAEALLFDKRGAWKNCPGWQDGSVVLRASGGTSKFIL